MFLISFGNVNGLLGGSLVAEWVAGGPGDLVHLREPELAERTGIFSLNEGHSTSDHWRIQSKQKMCLQELILPSTTARS